MNKEAFLLLLHRTIERLRPKIDESVYRYKDEDSIFIEEEITQQKFKKVAIVSDLHISPIAFAQLCETLAVHFKKWGMSTYATQGYYILNWSSTGLSQEKRINRMNTATILKEEYLYDPVQTDFIDLLDALIKVKYVDLFIICTDSEFTHRFDLGNYSKQHYLLGRCLWLVVSNKQECIMKLKTQAGLSKKNVLDLDISQ